VGGLDQEWQKVVYNEAKEMSREELKTLQGLELFSKSFFSPSSLNFRKVLFTLALT
jgi:hypothetical protein